MIDPGFDDVFRAATGLPQPYAYQCRLACGNNAVWRGGSKARRQWRRNPAHVALPIDGSSGECRHADLVRAIAEETASRIQG
jgi:hypothetical protein